MQFGENLTKLLDRAESAGNAAIRDEGHRLRIPLFSGGIDQLFQSRRIAVVIFRRDDDEGIGFAELRAECPVVTGLLCRRFVTCGAAVRGGIDHFDDEFATCAEFFRGPSRDDVAKAALAGAAVD